MELREKLRYGDLRQIAEITGMSYEMTRSVLTGRRGKRGKSDIIKVATELIESREALTQKNRKQTA